jgi:hypothetical protein
LGSIRGKTAGHDHFHFPAGLGIYYLKPGSEGQAGMTDGGSFQAGTQRGASRFTLGGTGQDRYETEQEYRHHPFHAEPPLPCAGIIVSV